MKTLLFALLLASPALAAEEDGFLSSLLQDARVVECPALTQCRIRCHNLHSENDRAFNRCVRRNCTDPGVCVEE